MHNYFNLLLMQMKWGVELKDQTMAIVFTSILLPFLPVKEEGSQQRLFVKVFLDHHQTIYVLVIYLSFFSAPFCLLYLLQ